ncbi:MAG: hypothetical protein KKF56_01225 [Nanoarchaeota archaeon]|nr:hypothetical protein [Nanoarchaeota archaeon]
MIRWILHVNDTGTEYTQRIREELERQEIPYSIEGGADPTESPCLITPAGRWQGYDQIMWLIGEDNSEEREVA